MEREPIHPPHPPARLASQRPTGRVYQDRLLSHQSGFTDALVFTSVAENTEAAICVLTGMSMLTEPSYDILVVNRSAETRRPPARSAAPCLHFSVDRG